MTMSLRALYEKVQCFITSYQDEWDSAIQSLAEYREETLVSILREREARARKKSSKPGKQSCAYLVNPKRVSLGKSRRTSSRPTPAEDTGKAVENEKPVAEIKRSVRISHKKAIVEKGQSLDGSSSSHEQLKPKKRRGRPKKRSTSEVIVPDTPESTSSPYQPSRQRSSIDQCLTPKRSLDSFVPMQESRKLMKPSSPEQNEVVSEPSRCESVERKAEDPPEQTFQQARRTPVSKPSSTPRQIFSPYSLDSTKRKAEAYENHIAKHVVPDIRLVQVPASPADEVSEPRPSFAQKRRSSLVKPCDKLVLAKAARMSETQRRSSLMRYHLQVAQNQVARKVSLEMRRSSLVERKQMSDLASEEAIETIKEQESPKRTSVHVDIIAKDLPQPKRSKQSDIILPVVIVKKLDSTFVLPESGSKHHSPEPLESGMTASEDPSEKAIDIEEKMNPQVLVERLNKKQIAGLSRVTVQGSPSVSDENSSSDSYISEDDQVSSTPVATHFTKKVPLSVQGSQPSTYKSIPVYPTSEPRPVQNSRVAFLASLLNSSNPGKRNSSTASSVRVTSFLKSRPPSQDFAGKKQDRLKEEFKRKKEKEELAYRRREQMLKDKVLSQKKKLNDKMAKVAENRLQREKEQQDKNRAMELQLQQANEKKRIQEEKRKEELEQRRLMRAKKEAEMEERRKQEEAAKLAKIKEQEALEKMRLQEQEQLKAAISHHNSSLQKKAIINLTVIKDKAGATASSKVDMNQTYSTEETNTYDITPHRSELPPEELKDPENYDIADLKSEEDTDDDDSPKKRVPNWAQGAPLKHAILQQFRMPPNLDVVFPTMPNIDLNLVFVNNEPKKMRTSSALWYSPPCR